MSSVVAAAARRPDPVWQRWVSDATAYARFAGPDGDGVQLWEHGGLGHTLLRIEPTQVAQPVTKDNHVWISADVRLDDRASLIATLRSFGQPIGGNEDDAELLLAAYAAWGDDLVEHIAGDFAFALWDARRRCLLCGRDQIGVVPLHYAILGDQLLVATSPDVLLLHPGVPDRLDDVAIIDFVRSGQPSDFTATAFAAIRRVPPAHVLRWIDGRVSIRRYWKPVEYPPLLRLPRAEDYVAEFRHILELAVADRCPSGPLAVQLSGGMDSTTVAALALRVRADRGQSGGVRAVTAALGGGTGDRESEFATLAAESLGIEISVLEESGFIATDPLATPDRVTPEPTPYQWSGWEYNVAEVAVEHARVCVTGLAGDVMIGSVPWYLWRWLAEGHPVRVALALGQHARLFHERPRFWLRRSAQIAAAAVRMPAPADAAWVVGHDGSPAKGRSPIGSLRQMNTAFFEPRALSREPAWPTWFTWGDPSYTRLALRLRHPLIDLRLLDLVSRLPPDPWLMNKRILREATADVLPDTIRTRPKTPFIEAARPSDTPPARDRLVALVELAERGPDIGRFLDTEALKAAIRNPATTSRQLMDVGFALGVVHWVAHWRRPVVANPLYPRNGGQRT